MDMNQTESARELIRRKLNSDRVKLWLQPYTLDDGQKGEYSQLVGGYSVALGLSETLVTEIIEELRQHALNRLAADRRFQETGIAILKVKLAGNIPDDVRVGRGTELVIETRLDVVGLELKHSTSRVSGIHPDFLKLIYAGNVLQEDVTLHSQQLRHQSQLMALCLSVTEVESIRQQQNAARIAKTRQAAELLFSKNEEEAEDQGHYHMQIADQTGKPLDLPTAERKALLLAMVLHEKGRSALKRREFGEALLYLLESDEEFKKCRSTILNAVDNYALVCLDIVWCYLCLQNIVSLPDAERRLYACDERFRASYGPNLERLVLHKGDTSKEKALFVRLHLLQAVVAFHQARNDDARKLLAKAEQELMQLTVSDDNMMQVMEMGYSQLEARLALRACHDSVPLAVQHIIDARQKKLLQMQEELAEKKQKRVARKLGKTASGQPVNIQLFDSMVAMGFAKGSAAEALRQSNNDVTYAIQVLQEHPEWLNLPDPTLEKPVVTDAMVRLVAGMGFDMESSRAALFHFNANVARSVEELLRTGGTALTEWIRSVPLHQSNSSSSSESAASGSTSSSSSPSDREKELMYERDKELIEDMVSDLPNNEEDYLDLALDDEATFLQEYQTKLASLL